MPDPLNPLIIQSDGSILLEVFNNKFEKARNELSKFAELVKSPEYIYTYKISPLSLWNAASSGLALNEILLTLENFSKFDIPENVLTDIKLIYERFGMVEIHKNPDDINSLFLVVKNDECDLEINANKNLKKFLTNRLSRGKYLINLLDRGSLKIAFLNYNIPVYDIAGYADGKSLEINLRTTAKSGLPFGLRDYQVNASESFYQSGSRYGGSGVVVLPCGAGKTIIGIDTMSKIKANTLILCTSVAAVHQWIREILDKTDLTEDDVGEYSGDKKVIKPVTICTYQILIYHREKDNLYPHFSLFQKNEWGLIIYDEVHLLPAPIFKITSEIQGTRRLGLTATLIREDGLEKDVFCLIGPKKFDMPWKVLEKQKWISNATCYEVKIPLPKDQLMEYLIADQKSKFNISSKNRYKLDVLKTLLKKHKDSSILVIGHFIDQIKDIAEKLNLPLITGKTTNSERDKVYEDFRNKKYKIIVVSKVANFSIDLPDASVLVQLSGTYGSRQEEAQRLGRILRPKENNVSYFYTLVTKESIEEQYAYKRQRFLTEQGYNYEISFWDKGEENE